MSRRATYKPVVWLRRLLLVALVAFLGIVTALLIKGRRPAGPVGEAEPTEIGGLGPADSEQVRSGKGFSHEVTEDGEPRYRIAASSWSSTRDERIKLNEVRVEFDRGDGDTYIVEAETGLYQQEASIATLLGNVRIRSSRGLEVKGQGFELRRKGTVIASTGGPVRFRYQDRFAGIAREVTSNLRRKRNELSGQVRIWSLAGEAAEASLTARRIVFEQEEQIIHAEGGVTMKRDGQQLTARRLSIELDEEGKKPRFVRARWDVEGSRQQVDEGVPQTVRFTGDQLSVVFHPATGDPTRAEIEGTPETPARLAIAQATGEVRQLETPYLLAQFAAGSISRVEALGPVDLVDFLAFDPDQLLASGCADSAEARFRRDGELASMLMEGGVSFHQPELQVTGDTLETKGSAQVVVNGEPARIHSRRGDFEAPVIIYRPEAGTGRASGGVRATLARDSGFGLMARAEEASEPVNVTADTADWSDQKGSVVFNGSVRAWQAENFLVASQLDVGSGGETITAKGAVKTVIKQTPEVGAEDPEDAAPLEVTATNLVYEGPADTLRYTGSPKARQSGRTVSCNELDVKLDEASEVEEMLCRGNALIDNPQEGQTVRGEEALYRPGSESVTVSGNPVVLRNANGSQVTGARVVYDLTTGAARVLTDQEAAAPTANEMPNEVPDGGTDEG